MGKIRNKIPIDSLRLFLILSLFTFSCVKYDNPISSNGEVCEGGNGTVSSSGRWQEFNTSNSCLPSNTIRCLEVDYKNNLWIGTDDGLVFYAGTEWIIYNTSNSLIPANGIWSLASEKDTIWVGFSNDGGLAKFDGNKWTVYDSTNSPLGEILSLPGSGPLELCVTDLTIDSKNNIWIATNAEGLYKFDKSNWTRYYPTYETPISSPAIITIDIDHEDVIWIGHSEPTGVDRFDGNNWTNYTPENSPLPSWYISDIYTDKMNVKWFTTNFGLAEFNNTNWIIYDSFLQNIPVIIDNIITDSKNKLWAGTGVGLLKKNNDAWISYYINDAPEPIYTTIFCIGTDQYDNKWFGTLNNGLYKFNENGIK